MGTFETKDNLGGAFLVDEDTIRRIFASIRNAHPDSRTGVQVSVTFEETRTIETSVIDDVFTDPMLRSKQITDFTIRCTSEEQFSRIAISKSKKPIDYRISGDRTWALSLEHQILNEIQATSRWWGYFQQNTKVRERLGGWIFALWLLAAMVLGAAAAFQWKPIIWLSLGVLSLIVLRFGIIASINILFPTIMFNFGWGARDYTNRSKIFGVVAGGIILALVVGLLTGWIGKKLGF